MEKPNEEQNISGYVVRKCNMGGIAFFHVLSGRQVLKVISQKKNAVHKELIRVKKFDFVSLVCSCCKQYVNEYEVLAIDSIHSGTATTLSERAVRREQIFAEVVRGIRVYCDTHEIMEVFPPTILPGNSRGDVFHLDFFSLPARLSSSAALYMDCLALVYSKVYSVHPVFRAEPSSTRMHLSEFMIWECAYVCPDMESMMDWLEYSVKSIMKAICARLGISITIDLDAPFARMEYQDLLITGRIENGFSKFEKGYFGKVPMFVTKMPKSISSWRAKLAHGEYTLSFNLLFPGIGEVAEGSVRSANFDDIRQRVHMAGETQNLGWLEDFLRFPSLHVANFGLGVERLTMALCNVNNIRKIKTFYRDRKMSEVRYE